MAETGQTGLRDEDASAHPHPVNATELIEARATGGVENGREHVAITV